MSYGRDQHGFDEPKRCENCTWFFNGNGHFQVKNKNGIRLCHNLHGTIDRRRGGLDCEAWEPEE